MKFLLLILLLITIGISNAGDVDTSTLFKDIKNDMFRGLIIGQLNKNIDSFKLDVFHQVTNETKAADGKRLAIIGDKELYSNLTLLKECIDRNVVLILLNINMEDKASGICTLTKTCNPNSDDYYLIFIPSHEGYSEYAFSLYKNKKTEAPSKVISSSEEPHPNKVANDEADFNSNFNAPFTDLAKLIEKEGLFQKYNYEKNIQIKNKNGDNEIEKRVVVIDRTGTVFGSKSLAMNEKLLKELVEKNIPVALLDVTQKEKEMFCKMIEGCSAGDSNFVLWVPYNNDKGSFEKVTIYDYLKDGAKNSVTFYHN